MGQHQPVRRSQRARTENDAPEALERIFDPFYRTPDSPGSGLGLTIARKLVEAHGGTITATSELGRGTTVRFHLPGPSAPQA